MHARGAALRSDDGRIRTERAVAGGERAARGVRQGLQNRRARRLALPGRPSRDRRLTRTSRADYGGDHGAGAVPRAGHRRHDAGRRRRTHPSRCGRDRARGSPAPASRRCLDAQSGSRRGVVAHAPPPDLLAIEALAAIGGPEAVLPLRQALDQQNWRAPIWSRRARRAAARALQRIGTSEAQGLLRDAATHGTRGARAAARAELRRQS